MHLHYLGSPPGGGVSLVMRTICTAHSTISYRITQTHPLRVRRVISLKGTHTNKHTTLTWTRSVTDFSHSKLNPARATFQRCSVQRQQPSMRIRRVMCTSHRSARCNGSKNRRSIIHLNATRPDGVGRKRWTKIHTKNSPELHCVWREWNIDRSMRKKSTAFGGSLRAFLLLERFSSAMLLAMLHAQTRAQKANSITWLQMLEWLDAEPVGWMKCVLERCSWEMHLSFAWRFVRCDDEWFLFS